MGSQLTVEFGSPDYRSLAMYEAFRHGLWLCPQVGIGSESLQAFFRREYLEKGAALFGRGSADGWDDFRRAGGDRLAKVSDSEIEAIVTFAVQRVRNYGHLLNLKAGRFKHARIDAIQDKIACAECLERHGRQLLVREAASRIERFCEMWPGDYATEIESNPPDFPPFHFTCRCCVEGVF